MGNIDVVPELKQILGAMIFGANRSISIKEMRICLQEVAQLEGGSAAAFGKVTEADLRAALDSLAADTKAARCGVHLGELAGGTRFQSDASCGRWLRHLLNAGKPNRLSRPALETLAIIAYRQPATRAEIEAVRGVTVDNIIRTLLEMQLIKIAGRSALPGRPFQYSTTNIFLEHFGLKDLNELSSMEPMLLAAREEQVRRQKSRESGERKSEVGQSVNEGTAEKKTEGGDTAEAEKPAIPAVKDNDQAQENVKEEESEEIDDEEDEFDDDDEEDDDEDAEDKK